MRRRANKIGMQSGWRGRTATQTFIHVRCREELVGQVEQVKAKPRALVPRRQRAPASASPKEKKQEW